MPFFKRRSTAPHSAAGDADELPESILDELTDSIGSLLTIHNLSDLDRSADGTPKTRPNSFCSTTSSNSTGLLALVQEEDAGLAADGGPGPTIDGDVSSNRRRASEGTILSRRLSPRRPVPLHLGTSAASSAAATAATEVSPTTSDACSNGSLASPLICRRRRSSLILAVDELDIKRQKRSSVPSFSGTYCGAHHHHHPHDGAFGGSMYGWSFGISDSERPFARASFSSGSSMRECPASPVLPFSPIFPSSRRGQSADVA